MMVVRPYEARDREAVRNLFITVNREIAPEHMKQEFDRYVSLALAEEIDRIDDYYASRGGAFWIVECGRVLVATYGLERVSQRNAEIRRMYVAPEMRRQGLASYLLEHAEAWCRAAGFQSLTLSTSELQLPALELYLSAGYRLVSEERVESQTLRTVGGGLRRYYLERRLGEG